MTSGLFNDRLIVDVEHHGITVLLQRQQRVSQNIPRNGLRRVFRQLSSEGLLHDHLSSRIGRIVTDGVAAEAVLCEMRRLIAEISAGGQAHEHLIILPVEGHFTDVCRSFPANDRPCRAIQRTPERHDIGIGGAPCVYQRLHFRLRHLCAHCLQCANSAAVATTEGSLFPFLPIRIIWVSFDDALLRNMKHATGSRFVDFAFAAKFLQHPFFVCQPCQHARLDGGKVRYEKTASIPWNECRADQLRKRTGNGSKERIQQFFIATLYDLPRQLQVRQMVLREVLCLHEPPRPSACTVGPIELQKPMYAPVSAYTSSHGLVFFDAGFA